MAAQSADRFAMLESRMLASNGPASSFEIGFRPPSNPPSSSALELSHRSPSPSLAAAAYTGGGMDSPQGGTAPKRKLSPDDSLGAHSVGASPDKRGKAAGPSPAKAKAKAAAPRAPSPSVRTAQSPDAAAPSASTPSTSRIDSFFAPKIATASAATAKGASSADRPAATSAATSLAAAAPSTAAKPPAQAGAPDAYHSSSGEHEAQAALEELRQSSAATQRQLSQVQAELEQARLEAEAANGAMHGMKEEITALRTSTVEERGRQGTGRDALREALREQCFRSRAEARERLARESVRLGRLQPEGGGFRTAWVPRQGTAMEQLQRRERSLERRKAALEEHKKALRKRRSGGKASVEANEAAELQDLEEGAKLRASLLAREQLELGAEKKSLEREAHEHFSELQLLQELDAVSEELRNCPSLPETGVVHEPGALSNRPDPGRFVLLELIGTGGFATVFKAYDLQRHEWVACKLHSVDSSWAEARKNDFVRHVEREIDITVEIRHRRILETSAAFELHNSAFVSVMPYCDGGSLADLLRRNGPLPEKDAKSVIVQVLHGLRHLHGQREPVIHFDLKPANILFHDGEVKLGDFGLAKVMSAAEEGAAQRGAASMELTSYGSGTHGFLPPECYDGETSRICPKVDIFSAGVVHYVALFYPHKPFFNQATQHQIMRMKPHDIRAETQQLEFPGKLSVEAQAFLRRTLNNNRQERPDVLTLLDDPYLARSK